MPAPKYQQWSQDTFDRLLEEQKKRREAKLNYKAPDYRQFYPQELDTKIQQPSLYEDMQDTILTRSHARTNIEIQKRRNQQLWQQMQAAKRARDRARRNMVHIQQNPTQYGSSGSTTITGGHIGKGGHFKDPTPLSGVGVGQNLRTVSWHGHSLTLNASAVNNFVGFLNALYKTGYRPAVIGSYANRNIAGTSTKSLHSYGLAIDIDPARNPVTWNGHNVTALPAGVGALAARYGLKWGGSWTGSKRDTMHFSIPYAGTM